MKYKPAKWIATLDNGEVITENKGDFVEKQGGLSSWNQLKEYIKENNCKITSMRVYQGGNVYHLPSIKPRFESVAPNSYNIGRKIIQTISNANDGERTTERYLFIEAIYSNFSLRLFVDEMGFRNSWTAIVPKK